MNNKIIFTASAAILIAWIALVLDAFDISDKVVHVLSNSSKPQVVQVATASLGNETASMKKELAKTPEAMAVPSVTSEVDSSGTAIPIGREYTSSEAKLNQIQSLVTNSITEDEKRLENLNSRREELLAMVDEIDNQSGELNSRLDKLNRLNEVFANEVDRPVAQTREDIGEKLNGYNKIFETKQAFIRNSKNKISISLKGDSLLLIDDKPLRISEYAAKHFNPVVESLRTADYQVDPITISVGRGFSDNHGQVLKRFLSRQYGWDVQIDRSERVSGLEINVSAKK
ncbi:MAG: hypothetical protein KDD61_12060 [Bdellovibrionales bacterium]|nr:hypothetical protein [Bdellovibrionales bacterium]